MPDGDDVYESMSALYADPANVEGTTYGRRWYQQSALPPWQRLQEGSTDAPAPMPVRKIAAALHGGGIEKGTSEIALAVAGFHPRDLSPLTDGLPRHDFWLFEGLLPHDNGRLHVTASHYDEPIAKQLIQASKRCISIHGCRDEQANGVDALLGGLDEELKQYVFEEATAVGIAIARATNDLLKGNSPDNVCNRTTSQGCAQLELPRRYRESLYGKDTRFDRKNSTNAEFWKLVGALRRAFERAS